MNLKNKDRDQFPAKTSTVSRNHKEIAITEGRL